MAGPRNLSRCECHSVEGARCELSPTPPVTWTGGHRWPPDIDSRVGRSVCTSSLSEYQSPPILVIPTTLCFTPSSLTVPIIPPVSFILNIHTMAPKRRNRVRPSMRPGRQVVPASLPAPFEWDSNLDDDDDDNNNGDDDDDDDDSSNEGEAEHDGRDNNTAQPSGSTTQDSDPVQKCGCSTTTTTTTRKRKRNVRDGAVGTDAGDDPPPRRRPVSAPDPRSGSRKSGENPHVEETEEEEQAPTTRTPVGPVWCVRCVEREACVWVPGMYAAGPAVSASILLCDTCVADKEVCHSVSVPTDDSSGKRRRGRRREGKQ